MPITQTVELLDRRIDSVFKRIFGNQDHPAPLIDLLNAIFASFNQPAITELEILNPTLEPDMGGDKTAILDIRARTEDGRTLNVEMQMVNSGNFIHRTLYYWAELYGESLHAGDDYRTLNRTITINLLNFKLFTRDRLISLYQLRDSEDQELLTDLMQIYFIELPKLARQPISAHLQQWLSFITIDDNRVLKALADVNPAIGEAYKMLNYISQDSEERMRHLRRKIALMDQKALERNAQEAEDRLKAAEERLQAAEASAHAAKQAEQEAKQAEQEAKQAEQKAKCAEQNAVQAERAAEIEKQVVNQRLERARTTLLALTRKLLTQRFGPLPLWAEEQLVVASLEQLEAVSEKSVDADSLKSCFQ